MDFNLKQIHEDINKDPLTWDFKLESGYSQSEVYQELAQLDWESAHKCVMPNRFEMHDNPQSPRLKSIQEYLSSDEVKNKVIDVLYENGLYSYWSIDPDHMKKITGFGGIYVLDKPGFSCARHVDNRSLICTGMLMFGEDDDAGHRTLFYRTDTSEELYWQSNSQFEHGWLNATLHNTWHEGYNNSQKDRYAYLFHVALRVF